MSDLDVLIITALPMEFDAAKSAGTATAAGCPGVQHWSACTAEGLPYLRGDYLRPDGGRFSVGLARPNRMGGRSTAAMVTSLARRLRPSCLAMSGVCAGDPARTALGDVVVAEVVYQYDEGKATPEGFQGDIRPYQLDPQWLREAQDLLTSELPSYGPASEQEATFWLLEQLLADQSPRQHPARERYFPDRTWQARLKPVLDAGFAALDGGTLVLTDRGRSFIENQIFFDPDGPDVRPFAVVVGPLATGNAVVEDQTIWSALRVMGMRTVAGLEMEAATIATVAEELRIPHWLVAKGVMDHAGERREDRYKRFAARASAEVMYALLGRLAHAVTRAPAIEAAPAGVAADLAVAGLYRWSEAEFAAGMDDTDVPVGSAVPSEGVVVDVVLLRSGGLPDLQRQFVGLGQTFDGWLTGASRKRGDEGLRVCWIVGEPGAHRSKALLAAVARTGADDRAVFDAGGDLGLAAWAIGRIITADDALRPPLVAVDLPGDQPGETWHQLRAVLARARRQVTRQCPYPLLVVGGTAAQARTADDVVRPSLELTTADVLGRPHQRPRSQVDVETLASVALPAEHIYDRGLPLTTRHMVGREADLEMLRAAWASADTRVLSLVAFGGVGKSTLINGWLQDMREQDYRGAQRLFAWSFYSQGTKENAVSADAFVGVALDWLGDPEAVKKGAQARGERLAELIKQHRFLLILDGLEPLQYPMSAPDVGGGLTDATMRALLEELAKPDWHGLCLITTRVPLTGLAGVPSAMERRLENLSPSAGVDLLRRVIRPEPGTDAPLDPAELRAAVEDVGGHALAINLLGRYVRDVHAGDLRGRRQIVGLTVAVDDGGHARRIMETYAGWLERYERTAELGILHVLGLFDRPAQPEALDAVLQGTSLSRTVPGLEHVGSAGWNTGIDNLRRSGLLSEEAPESLGTLDTHPLVREHFQDRMRLRKDRLWRDGNLALFRYYQLRAKPQPADVSEMGLLYAAVNHGCAIELHQQVYDDVLLPRVWQGSEHFSTRHLGMTGSEIGALSNYFKPPQWTELRDVRLSPDARLMVLSNAGLRLRQLGRINHALETCRAVLGTVDRERTDAEALSEGAFAAGLYCELLTISGRLDTPSSGDTARSAAVQAMAFADDGPDPYFRMYTRACLAEVEFMLGNAEEAGTWFARAIAVEQDQHPRLPFLYSQNLYRYGYFLIETGRAEQLLADADRDPSWGTAGEKSSVLSGAIRLLILGAARRRLLEQGSTDMILRATACGLLDEAVIMLRGVGYPDYVVRGLLERACLLRLRGDPEDYPRALADLARAEGDAVRGGMQLLHADVLLERVACLLATAGTAGDQARHEVRRTLTEARALVDAIGYGRRRPLLARLEQAASVL